MSPNAAFKSVPSEPMTVVTANSNAQPKKRVRQRARKEALPPVGTRNLSQKIQAADEHWQELIEAYNRSLTDGSKANDLCMVAAFSCFVHSFFDNKDLCREALIDFVTRLGKEKPEVSSIFS